MKTGLRWDVVCCFFWGTGGRQTGVSASEEGNRLPQSHQLVSLGDVGSYPNQHIVHSAYIRVVVDAEIFLSIAKHRHRRRNPGEFWRSDRALQGGAIRLQTSRTSYAFSASFPIENIFVK